MRSDPSAGAAKSEKRTWQQMVAKYQNPSLQRSLWQVANTLIPYFVLLILMYVSLSYSYWMTLALALPAGGLLTRSLLFSTTVATARSSNRSARITSSARSAACWCSPPTTSGASSMPFTTPPRATWIAAAWAILSRMTVDEYLKLPRWGRFKYRLYRSPIVMLGLGPWFTFLISQRFVNPISKKRERFSVYFSNLFIVALLVVAANTIGVKEFLLIQLPVAFIGGLGGIWMFYIQHQFEGTYWQRHEEWDYATAAIRGSSYFKLPKVLQWFTGNIGFHHIHHLSSRIPNYALQKCMEENPEFQNVTTITLWSSMKSLGLNLWDEEQRQLVSFRQLKRLQRQQQLS